MQDWLKSAGGSWTDVGSLGGLFLLAYAVALYALLALVVQRAGARLTAWRGA